MHTRCTRGAHAVHTRCTRGAHAVHTRCTRGAHAVHMRCTRGAHAVHMRCTRGHSVLTIRSHADIHSPTFTWPRSQALAKPGNEANFGRTSQAMYKVKSVHYITTDDTPEGFNRVIPRLLLGHLSHTERSWGRGWDLHAPQSWGMRIWRRQRLFPGTISLTSLRWTRLHTSVCINTWYTHLLIWLAELTGE